MRWQLLSALTNGWLWVLAVLAGVVLVLASAPVWFAVLSGAAVLLGGAGVQGAVEWSRMKRERGIGATPPPASGLRTARRPALRDPEAAALVSRAQVAAARAAAVPVLADETTASVAARAEVATTGAVDALYSLGQQAERLGAALAGIRPDSLASERAAVAQQLDRDAGASPELVAERRRTVAGLDEQIAVHRRLVDQRTLVLERMRAGAVGLEGLAARLTEVSALAADPSSPVTGEDDLRSLATEVEDLRQGLVEAEQAVRRSWGGTSPPGTGAAP